MPESTTVHASGMVFDARRAGPVGGEPVLLLHGFPQTSSCWTTTLDALGAHGFLALAPDQRGYSPGARPRGVRAYRIEDLVDDVLAIAANGAGADRFHVVGHDWGGAVAWALAARRPERLRSLTVVSTPHPSAFAASLARSSQLLRSSYMPLFATPLLPEALLGSRRAALLRRVLVRSGLPPEDAGRYAAKMTEPGALTAALNWYRAVPYAGAGVDAVTSPTLFVWGDRDFALGPVAARRTARYVRREYRFEVMAGAGHWIPETRGEQLSALLLEHLGRPAGATATA